MSAAPLSAVCNGLRRVSAEWAGQGQLQEAAELWHQAAQLFPEWLRAPLLKRASWQLGRCLTRAAQTQRLQVLAELAGLYRARGLLRLADRGWRKVLREGQFRSGDEEAALFGVAVAVSSPESSDTPSSSSAGAPHDSEAAEAKTRHPAQASADADRAQAARAAVTETLLATLDSTLLQRVGLSRELLWAPVVAPAPSVFQPRADAAAAELAQWQAHTDSDLRSQLEHARESAAALEERVWSALRPGDAGRSEGRGEGEEEEEDRLSEVANLVGELLVKLHHVLDQAVMRWVNDVRSRSSSRARASSRRSGCVSPLVLGR